MRVLILSSEVWNDRINGNNIISNWFDGMDAEFANIYGSPGEPYNKCCRKYFQVTDMMMAKSIITRQKAGREVVLGKDNSNNNFAAEREPRRLYKFLKSISGSFMRLVRECIWLWGRYDIEGMKKFINDFSPDVIFSERMASAKMLRLERIVTELCTAPMAAFTGDDEYSLRQFSFSPFFWINRFMVRGMLRKMVEKYSIYYTLSYEQKLDYEKRFGCRVKVLQKCGQQDDEYRNRKVNYPVRIIYAGKLYCNRWKVLAKIAKNLSQINKRDVKAILEIYTMDKISRRQRYLLDDGRNSYVHGAVSQEKLKELYNSSDVALHVESRDIKYRLKTRLSFSTKIIDCIFSGCAILAYSWKGQSGWRQLKREKAAICVSDDRELKRALKAICKNPHIIRKYACSAYECGKRNHRKDMVQKQIMEDFKLITCKIN